MSDKAIRLSKLAREFNVGISTIVEFLHKKGVIIDTNPNNKVTPEIYEMLMQEYSMDQDAKKESEKLHIKSLKEKHESITLDDIDEKSEPTQEEEELIIKDTSTNAYVYETDTEKEIEKEKIKAPKVLGKIDVDKPKKTEKKEIDEEKESVEEEEAKKEEKPEEKEVETEATKEKAEELDEDIIEEELEETIDNRKKEDVEVKVLGKIDLESMNQRTRPPRKTKEQKEEERKAKQKTSKKETSKESQKGTELKQKTQEKEVSIVEEEETRKPRRKRIRKGKERVSINDEDVKPSKKTKSKKHAYKKEISEEDVQQQIKDTLARLTSKGKSKSDKYRREKREAVRQKMQEQEEQQEIQKSVLKVTEFVTVSELASMMNISPNEIISACMSLGMFVSINQRLDAETISLMAEEFEYNVEFVSADIQENIHEEEDKPNDLQPRSPIVTVMGHVDHGKTKLLDYIRNTNVIAGEAGSITQHIGAYSVSLEDGRQITFLDTPGHEAFTAMRARGAQITDVAIIVVAADDGVKPQTVEAINHAQAAGVPMVFAINKIDKSTANPDKVKEELANMNILVEDWGGKYQSQEISAKNGINIEDLLEKVLLEAELLELKANKNKRAKGTVIESTLDRGRGFVTTLLVEAGTLRIGDIILAGIHTGRVKAMFNERGKTMKEAGPATPVVLLGLNGAPQAGDKFNILNTEKETREIANRREQLQREQGLRTQKHITLDEIGRRIAIGNFQELNVIVKGDVDGSIEALSDALIKLSTEEIQVNIIHKAVGQISEGDILLAAASNAIVIGFQVRPSMAARKLAEKEEIDVRLYSVIYDAIDQIKSAMEGMLSPEIKEEVMATLEVKEIFKITKVGTVAGCEVKEGKIKSDAKVRVIREGIVVYTGDLGALKRFKEDAKEVTIGLECGISIENYNDIKVGDIIEAYQEIEIKKKL